MCRLAVWLAAIAATSTASAQPIAPSNELDKASQLFAQGRQLLVEQDDAAGACAKFREAIDYDPNGDGIMLNLGLCNELLGKYKTALYWFRRAQTRASESNAPDDERAAREHTTALASKVATVAIAITGTDARAEVRIDGEVIKPEDFPRVEVDPGHHALDAGAPGMRTVHQEFDVEGRGGQTLAIELVPGDNRVVVDPGRPRKRIAIGVACGGGALWVAAGGYSLYEKSKYDATATAAAMGDKAALAETRRASDRAATYGTGLFVAGSLVIAGAAVIYLTAPSRQVIDRTVLVPVVDRDGVGVAASGRF